MPLLHCLIFLVIGDGEVEIKYILLKEDLVSYQIGLASAKVIGYRYG